MDALFDVHALVNFYAVSIVYDYICTFAKILVDLNSSILEAFNLPHEK